MATALVKSPTSASREDQELQFGSSALPEQLQQQPEAQPAAEALQATKDMCAYCFGEWCRGLLASWWGR